MVSVGCWFLILLSSDVLLIIYIRKDVGDNYSVTCPAIYGLKLREDSKLFKQSH